MNYLPGKRGVLMKISQALFAVVVLSLSIVASAAGPAPDKVVGASAAAPRAVTTLTEAQVEAKLAQMTALCQGGSRTELIAQFKDEDIAAWPAAFKVKRVAAEKVVDGLYLRGTGFYIVKDYARAEKDFKLALQLSPDNGYLWNSMGDVYRDMKDREKALDAYIKAYESDRAAHTAKSYGWMPINATLEAANILTSQTRYPEALKVLERYDDKDIQEMGFPWGCKLLRAYGQVYAATGREEEASAKFKAALELDKKQGK